MHVDANGILASQWSLIEYAKDDPLAALVLRQMAERIIYEMQDVPEADRFIPDLTDMCLRAERKPRK